MIQSGEGSIVLFKGQAVGDKSPKPLTRLSPSKE